MFVVRFRVGVPVRMILFRVILFSWQCGNGDGSLSQTCLGVLSGSHPHPCGARALATGANLGVARRCAPRKTIRNNIMCQSLFVGIHMRVSGLASATSARSGTKLCLRCRSPVAKYRRHSHGPRPAYGLPAARRRQFTAQEKKVDKGAEMEFNRVEVSDC